MSEYSDIKDFNYNATINKSITIKNGDDLKGATLEVVTDGVTLNGIKKANVTTQSSLKISSSSLSSLSIAAVPSANASQISGRGVSDNMRVNPPTVETDNTTVTSAVTVAIENAQIVAEKLIANEINLAGMNTQLTLKDNVSNISKITTDKVCQVVLEKGASSSIPTTKEKINVTGNGELTQIDMTAVSDKKLIAFTPMSGVKSVVKKGSAIDFSGVVMLGTYRSEGSCIKVFRALSEGELIDTFSKLEKDFVVKIGNEETVVFKNGESKNSEFWVGLEAKTYSAYIVSEYQPQDAGCEYQFEITVLDIDGDDDDLPEFELKSIEVSADNVKEHTVGDTLNLRGLVVLGNYEQGKYSYNGIITDYTLDPPNGTPLTAAGTQSVTVTAEGKTETIEIIVKEAQKQQVTVTFDMGGVSEKQTRTIDQDSTVDAVVPGVKTGYSFDGWYKKIGDKFADESYDFAVSFSEDTTLYAVWTANTYKVTLNNDGSTSTLDVTFDTIVPTITVPSKTGFTFKGYFTENGGQGTKYIDDKGIGCKNWDIAENKTLYAYFLEKGKHSIEYRNTKGVMNITPTEFKESDKVTLTSITADGYTFGGWSVVTNDVTVDETIDGWNAGAYTTDVVLWARWTANHYTVTLNNDGNTNTIDVIYDTIVPSITKPTKIGYTFDGYWTQANGQGEQYIDANGQGKKWDIDENVTLYVKWIADSVNYTVKYYFQTTAGGDSYEHKDESYDTKIGITESSTNVTADEVTGFTALDIAQQTIAADGLTVVNVYYNRKTITYTFNANGGEFSDGSDQTTDVCLYGASVNVPIPTKTGYHCSWNPAVPETFGAENQTFTAQWSAITYTIHFNANGGEGTMNNLSMTYDVSADLSANTFTRENYLFKGWALSADDEVVYTDGQEVKNLTADNGAEVTLYAVWSNTFVLANGNMQINGVEYSNTSFIKVTDTEVTVDGSDDNWSSYLDSSASGEYKGAFISGRNVKLSPYSMAQYFVTQELYEAVMSSGRNYDKNSTDEGKHPAYYVSWYDAITFCNKLSLLMGKEPCYTVSGITDWAALENLSIPTSTDSTWNAAACDITKNGYRLPTEAEWEFAARGGDQSKADWKYAFSGIQSLKQVYRGTTESDTGYGGTGKNLKKDDNLATVGWYTENSSSKVHSVGGKTANRLGLSDMSGNLMEWCWDWHNGTVTSNDGEWIVDEVVTNPMGAGSGSNRCLRGGFWYNDASFCSVSYRSSGNNPYSRNHYIGFRLVCSGE